MRVVHSDAKFQMFQRFSLPRIVTSALKAFARSQRGNVAITFAIATIPLIGFVGATVDYSRANSLKVALQGALDATALMVAKGVPTRGAGARGGGAGGDRRASRN